MSEDKSVTETKPDQSSISREKQPVNRRRQREYTLYFHRDWNGWIYSLSTRPPENDPLLSLLRNILFFLAVVFFVVVFFATR